MCVCLHLAQLYCVNQKPASPLALFLSVQAWLLGKEQGERTSPFPHASSGSSSGCCQLAAPLPFGVPPDTGWDGVAVPRLPVWLCLGWGNGGCVDSRWLRVVTGSPECPGPVTQAETGLGGSQQPPAPSAFWLIAQLQLYRLLNLGLILFLHLLASCSAHFLVTPFLLPMSDLPKLVPILFSIKLQFFFFSLLIEEAFCTLLRFPSPPAFVSSCLCWAMFAQRRVSPSAAFHCFILGPRALCPDPGQQAQPAQPAASPRHGAVPTMLVSSWPNTYALIKRQ